jgi:ABC-type dipeptide/oligopeptide/nickel transport system permease subunit
MSPAWAAIWGTLLLLYRSEDHAEAAQTCGAGHRRISVSYLIPRLVLLEAARAFLGIGFAGLSYALERILNPQFRSC